MKNVLAMSACFAVLLASVAFVRGAAAGRPTCLVSNERTGVGSRSLQDGIDAAAAGDTLVVKGTCAGGATVGEDLTLKGVSNKPFGAATLDGGGHGTVLTVSGGRVTIGGLTIANGGANERGGGLDVGAGAEVTLERSTLSRNVALEGGGGIFNAGALAVGDSTFSGNDAESGGGIENAAGATLSVERSTFTGNNAFVGGGGIANEGTGTVAGTTFTGNGAEGGGALDLAAGSTTTVEDATISGNHAFFGGGILSEIDRGGEFTLDDSQVTGNSAFQGGGILGPVTSASGDTVTGNTEDDCSPAGTIPGCG